MMLTKQEREEIAGRLKKCTCMIADSAYKALFNKEVPSWTTWQQDSNDAINRILDLCDTSNMIELPLDKDGKIINIGDKVRDVFGRHLVVVGISYRNSENVLVDGFDDTDGVIYSDYSTFLLHD